LHDKWAKLLKPGLRSLFETIDSLVKLTDMGRMLRINKTRRLSHENRLLKKAIQEGILDIKLLERPTERNC
jgi:hypothetical protein